MRTVNHKYKIEAFEKTASKLDLEEDSETLIEVYMLISSHYINSAMHKLRTLKEDRDIKHNKLSGFLKRENALHNDSEEVSASIDQIEQLRPSYVYGKGQNGKSSKIAKDAFEKIKEICERIIEDEPEPEDS
jgi:hypothetical protein